HADQRHQGGEPAGEETDPDHGGYLRPDSRLRTASPPRLATRLSTSTAMPGMAGIHQCASSSGRLRAVSAPSSGAGAGWPSPRNDRLAITSTTLPTSRLAVITAEGPPRAAGACAPG